MNENIKEKISALADGELSEFEVRRVLDEIEKEPDLRNYWDLLQITRRSLINEASRFRTFPMVINLAQSS